MKRNVWFGLIMGCAGCVVVLMAVGAAGAQAAQAGLPTAEAAAFTTITSTQPIVLQPQGGGGPGAVGPAFTYQGLLKQNGAPINTPCDFQFSLWDSSGSGLPPTGGIQIGKTETETAVTVSNGLFNVVLNFSPSTEFGTDAFNGQGRWLAISVRCPAGGTGAYTVLGYRQPLWAAPYALSLMPGTTIDGDVFGNPPDNVGVLNLNNTGYGSALVASSSSPSSTVILGFSYANSGLADGVAGVSYSSQGSGVVGANNSSGIGVEAFSTSGTALLVDGTGKISSTADSTLYLSPHSLINRGSASVLITPTQNGSVIVQNLAGTEDKYLTIPVSTFGTLFGSQLYVKSVQVCYAAGSTGNIAATAVTKNDGSTGSVYYIFDVTSRNQTARSCYTLPATTPRKAIDNSSWVQLNMNFGDATANAKVTIYSIALVVTESLN